MTNLSETWTSRSECAGRDGHVAQLPPHGCVKVVLHVPGATLLFLFTCLFATNSAYCLPAAPRRPGSPASGASRVPPPTPAAARLGSRPSRSPVGREPARRRAARRAEGSGLKTRGPRPGRGKSVDARHDHTRRPSSDAKYGTDSRGESAKARARGLSTPARGANRAPCQGREARGRTADPGRWAILRRPIAPAGLQKYRRCGFHA